MASSSAMREKNLSSAEAYYMAMKDNNAEGMAKYLHLEVQVISPMDNLAGKDQVLAAAKRLMKQIAGIDIRTRLSSGEQVLLVYDMDCGEPVGKLRTAALLTFREGLIIRNELFFDARPFEKTRQQKQ